LCASYILLISEKFIDLLYFELKDQSPKRKYHIVNRRSVKPRILSYYIRPDFSKPHVVGAVARHMTRLATPM